MSPRKNNTNEYLIGVFIGLLISFLFFAKLCFGQTITGEETEMIAGTVNLEAENQDFNGKRYVAAVVLNRQAHPAFPDTIDGVLSQEGQFSTYNNLSAASPTWEDRLAVQMEIESRSNEEILFFRTGHYGTGEPIMKYQDHYFSGLADGDKNRAAMVQHNDSKEQ